VEHNTLTTQEISFGQRLADEAQRARDMALALPSGKKRDAFLEKARFTRPRWRPEYECGEATIWRALQAGQPQPGRLLQALVQGGRNLGKPSEQTLALSQPIPSRVF
jgi:hypothetical protein